MVHCFDAVFSVKLVNQCSGHIDKGGTKKDSVGKSVWKQWDSTNQFSCNTLLRALNTPECTVNAQKQGYFQKHFSNLFDNGTPEYIFGNTAEVTGNRWKGFS